MAELAQHDLSLDVVPRGDGVTVGGAVSTGTHGSGARIGSLSSLVRAVRLVDGRGELHRIDGPDLDAVRVGLGALGVLTEVDLAVVPERTLAAGEELRPLTALLDEGFLEVHDWTELEVFPDGPPWRGGPTRSRRSRWRSGVSRDGPSRWGRLRPPDRRTRSAVWFRAWRRLCGAPRAGGAARRSAPRTGCSSRNGRCGPR